MTIHCAAAGEEGLDAVGPLWEKLNEYQGKLSPRFADYFAARTYARRREELLETSRGGALRIDLATDTATGTLVGYCVTTVTRDKQGRIESIFIEPVCRRSGIGEMLMRRALRWMDEQKVVRKRLEVGAGNEGVFEFYERFGFHPRVHVMEWKDVGR